MSRLFARPDSIYLENTVCRLSGTTGFAVDWSAIHARIKAMLRAVFEGAARVHPEMHDPHARAMYGVDVMLDQEMQPKLLEVRQLWLTRPPRLQVSIWMGLVVVFQNLRELSILSNESFRSCNLAFAFNSKIWPLRDQSNLGKGSCNDFAFCSANAYFLLYVHRSLTARIRCVLASTM
jgi:hypothetical protein